MLAEGGAHNPEVPARTYAPIASRNGTSFGVEFRRLSFLGDPLQRYE